MTANRRVGNGTGERDTKPVSCVMDGAIINVMLRNFPGGHKEGNEFLGSLRTV